MAWQCHSCMNIQESAVNEDGKVRCNHCGSRILFKTRGNVVRKVKAI